MNRDPRDLVPNYGQYTSEEEKAALKRMEKNFKKEEKARKKEEKRQEKLAWAATSKSERRASGIRHIGIGIGVFAIGVGVTVGSAMFSSETGGWFLVTYGAIIVGIGMVAKGIWRLVANMGADQTTRLKWLV